MQDNRLWILMSRRLSGEATQAEMEELQLLMEQFPERQFLLDILHSYFSGNVATISAENNAAGYEPEMEERFLKIVDEGSNASINAEMLTDEPQTGPGWDETELVSARESFSAGEPVPDREPVPARVIALRRWRVAGYAAAVAALFWLGWIGLRTWNRERLPAAEPVAISRSGEVVARPGVRTRMVLPDGTLVWLNSNSKLNYTDGFNTRSREVELEGEAYFNVAKNANLPFIVHSASINIKVLGTSFTIKSYPQDETIETTLLNGVIEFSRLDNPNAPRIILKPNEKLVFSKRLSALALSSPNQGASGARPTVHVPQIAVSSIAVNIPDSDKVETSWMYNKLVFNGDSFRDLAEKMERWYNVTIRFRDDKLFKYRFAGVFADESVEEALNALQLTAKFSYSINGNEIELFKNQEGK